MRHNSSIELNLLSKISLKFRIFLNPTTGSILNTLLPVIFLSFLTTSAQAQVSFADGITAYEEERFEEAFNIFLPLAKLGHADSQNNVAAFYLNAIGVAEDIGSGHGWLRAAATNGATVNTASLESIAQRLSPDQQLTSNEIFFDYQKTSLLRTTLPIWGYCSRVQPARRLQLASFSFPANAPYQQDAVIQVSVLIGKDNIPRDPVVIAAAPAEPRYGFERNAVSAVMRSRFQAATLDGEPIEQRLHLHFTFYNPDGGVLWNFDTLNTYQEYATNGVPQAQFVMGANAMLDGTLGINSDQAHDWMISAAQAGFPAAQRYLGHITANSASCSNNNKSSQWFAAAARGGDHESMVMTAQHLLDEKSADHELISFYLTTAAEYFIDADEASDYVLKHLVALLASHPQEQIRNPELALEVAKQIKQSSNPDPQAQEAVAAANASQGNYRRAVRLQKRAIDKADDLFWDTTAMQVRLNAWENEQVWYGDLLSVIENNEAIPELSRTHRESSCREGGCRGDRADQENVQDTFEGRAPTGSRIPLGARD